MAVELGRRDLLRGRLKALPVVMRPPYAIAEREFLSLCEPCPDCATSCEEGVIKIDKTGFPKLSFLTGECTFCEDCVTACKTGALDRKKARPWNWIARIGGNCLSFNAVMCRSCGDTCEEEAIKFKLMTMGRSLPLVDESKCTGCGACAFACPNRSISMVDGQQPQNQESEGQG